MIDVSTLFAILDETTTLLRKGPVVSREIDRGVETVTIDAMPDVDSMSRMPGVVVVDLDMVAVAVRQDLAAVRREALGMFIKKYSEQAEMKLAFGPSYIHVGAEIGDQGAALRLFALGKVLGFWDLVTPTSLGATGEDARNMARAGYVMIIPEAMR